MPSMGLLHISNDLRAVGTVSVSATLESRSISHIHQHYWSRSSKCTSIMYATCWLEYREEGEGLRHHLASRYNRVTFFYDRLGWTLLGNTLKTISMNWWSGVVRP